MVRFIIIISLFVLFVIIGIGVRGIITFIGPLPDLKPVLKYEGMEVCKFPTKVYSLNNELIAEFAEEKREVVSLDNIPKLLKEAFVAVEDKHFYKHKGVDVSGILRAFLANIRAKKIVQGGSTITQQLARNVFSMYEDTYRRKIREIVLALLIERKLTKNEILERYLNKIYLGHGNYGVAEASSYYFDKPVKDLNLAEIALLVGIPPFPEYYCPINYSQNAAERQAYVLKRMEEEGIITSEQRLKAKEAFAILIKEMAKKKFDQTKSTFNNALYFTEYIRQILYQEYGVDAVYADGLNVQTTLDLKMQEAAIAALGNGLVCLNQVKKPGELRIEGALLAIDPTTGYIRAMVGGSGFTPSNQLNRVIHAKRQIGSTFKPFIYATAIDQGFTPADILDDSPKTYLGAKGKDWKPTNYDNKFYGCVTLRCALELSLNLATIKLLEEIGVNNVIEYAHKMGIKSELPPDSSLALGTAQVTLLEMMTAFGVFANQGIKVEPMAIKSIKDRNQKLLEKRTTKKERVISPQTAYLMTSMLEGVVQRGTARDAIGNKIDRAIAGKTGTTNDYVDAWFIGYTPELVVGVWIGYDSGQKSLGPGQSGGVVAAPIWTDFIKRILPLLESTAFSTDFPVPDGIKFVNIDSATGMLATKHCPQTRYEVFIEGNLPTQYCSYHSEAGKTNEN